MSQTTVTQSTKKDRGATHKDALKKQERLRQQMKIQLLKQRAKKFSKSKKALAVPVTFLMLFGSLFVVISVTYYFAVTQVNSNSQMLKISSAKQNMNTIEQTMQYVLWQPGASKNYEFSDCGGTLKTTPTENLLTINVTDGTFSEVVFNSSIGGILYELPYSRSADTGRYLKGTSQVVENKTGAVMAQLYIQSGEEHPEIVLENSRRVNVQGFSVNSLTVRTNFDSRKFLVYNDNFQKGWRVFIDGKPSRLWRANIAFKGVWVPAGEHTISFRFGTPAVYLMKFIMISIFYFIFVYLVVLGFQVKEEGQVERRSIEVN